MNRDARHVVYVFRSSDGDVLYVGSTSALAQRLANHQAMKDWYGRVANVEVRHCPDKASARQLEADLTAQLRPEYDVVSNREAAQAVPRQARCRFFRWCGSEWSVVQGVGRQRAKVCEYHATGGAVTHGLVRS